MSWFSDDADFDSGPIREIERLYFFLFDSFSEVDWNTLGHIYASIPGSQPSKTTPYWFGTEETGNYLWVSVEPPGLQVAGILREADWLAWETAFHEQVKSSSLPRYEVTIE